MISNFHTPIKLYNLVFHQSNLLNQCINDFNYLLLSNEGVREQSERLKYENMEI